MKEHEKELEEFPRIMFDIKEDLESNEYKCAECNGIFVRGITEEETREQYKKEFPNETFNADTCVLICDDCYQDLMKIIKSD